VKQAGAAACTYDIINATNETKSSDFVPDAFIVK
jgi:hypothetical protein